MNGGGAATITRKEIYHHIVKKAEEGCDMIATLLTCSRFRVYMINVYRYPNGSLGTFFDELNRTITLIYNEEAEARIIIVGDFNIDLLKHDAKKKKLENFTSKWNLKISHD